MAAGTTNHKDLASSESHVVNAFEYANDSARTGASGLVAADNGKYAIQTDTGEVWRLSDYSGPTWIRVGTNGKHDTISERTAGSGVTVDGVVCKDNAVTASGGFTGDLTGDVTGTVSTATQAGTVTGATQAAITSAANLVTVGTLTGGNADAIVTRNVSVQITTGADAITVGDGKGHVLISDTLAGFNLTAASATILGTASASGGPITISLERGRGASIGAVHSWNNMLSTNITIPDTKYDSEASGGTPAVVNGTYDDLAEGDVIKINLDDVGDAPSSIILVRLTFAK